MQNLPHLLLVSDFDQTIAQTFALSPNRIGVEEAYRFAIRQTFGGKALPIYDDIGGLKNRAPSELVQAMLFRNDDLAKNAREIHRHLSSTPVLSGLEWQSEYPHATISAMLVRFKMHRLMEEICEHWPLSCTGFSNLMSMLESLRDEINIELGIISSGHEEFIRKTFSTWEIPCPDVLVTEDDIRDRKYPADIKCRVKPSPFPLALFFHKWLKLHEKNFSMELVLELRKRTIYFGDDPAKDGELAKNAGIPFGWFMENGKSLSDIQGEFPGGSFSFSDWSVLANFIKSELVGKMLRSNLPLSQIFAHFP